MAATTDNPEADQESAHDPPMYFHQTIAFVYLHCMYITPSELTRAFITIPEKREKTPKQSPPGAN